MEQEKPKYELRPEAEFLYDVIKTAISYFVLVFKYIIEKFSKKKNEGV